MNWFEQAKIKKARLGDAYSYMDIAREFNVHYDTVRKKFKKDSKVNEQKVQWGFPNTPIDAIEEDTKPATGGFILSNPKIKVNLEHASIVPSSLRELISPKVEVKELPLEDRVLDIITKGARLEEICETCQISPLVLMATLTDIKDQGYNLFEAGDYVRISKVAIPSSQTHELAWDGSHIVRYGIVSDTHLCSKSQQLTHLNSIYDSFAREKISTVLHIGDLVEGINMRKGHEYELFVLGFDGQADYAIEKYPYRDGITTKFITGNHDHTGIKSAGADVGRRIAKERSDMEYLGLSNARIKVTPNCTLELNHGLDGSSYALSYTLQKCIDAMDGNDLPDIFLNGHHHKLMYTYYRNIHALECGTFQAQTPWMRGKRLAAHVGGLILTLHVDDNGKVKRFIPEFIPFYKKVENDY